MSTDCACHSAKPSSSTSSPPTTLRYGRRSSHFGLSRWDWGRKPRHLLSGVFIAYSLVYPLLAAISGHIYPRAPAFAVPCPTALLTAAILLAAVPPVPRWLFVAPIVWSVIGGSAAVLLGMTPDLMLFAATFVLLIHCVDPKKLERPRLGSRL